MKNKTKKILAATCLSVMGAAALTGCSMSDAQQEALDKVVSKTDQIIELVERQNKELSHAEAVRLYEYSKARLIVNKDNVWDNMKMIIAQDSNEEGIYGSVRGEQHFYRFADGKRVMYGRINEGGRIGEIDGWFSEVVPNESSEPGTMTSTQTYTYCAGSYATAMIGDMEIYEEDIVDCKITDNGNYIISAIGVLIDPDTQEPYEKPMVITVELTADGYLVSYTSDNVIINNPQGMGMQQYIVTTSVKYEYGTLTDADVQANIDAYIAQEAANS